jgi:hypothetical protein
LQLNGRVELPIAANGAFTFGEALADGAVYEVTIRSQPVNPAQTCTVSSGAGRISGVDVTNVAVVCASGSASFGVGGVVSGLSGSGLVLRNNGSEDLPIASDGEFIFHTAVATGAAYNVTVAAQPANPVQTCSVENGAGVMGGADVTTVRVICSIDAFTIGGTVSGLASLGLLLRNNDEVLAIGGDGPFTFLKPVPSGASYLATVEAQPQGQNCVVADGAGVVQNANVTNVRVTCASNLYTIGGSISGLAAGARVVLRLNAGGQRTDYEATRNGPLTFDLHLTEGAGYVVTVEENPTNPAQTCSAANAAGIVSGANVTNIEVTCVTRRFTIGGTVEGLQGAGLVLRLNGAYELPIASNGSFEFDAQLDSGSRYEATVAAHPSTPPQTCTVQGGSGTVGDANTRNVRVTCALNTYSIGGTVSGLLGQGLVMQNSGGDPVEIAVDGAFTFPTPVATGGSYSVTVRTAPSNPAQSCSVTNGLGIVGAEPVTNIVVTCINVFTIGGAVSGLAGSGLILQNNGRDDLAITADGSFIFTTRLTSGAAYNVSIAVQPLNPSQTCVVANGAGAIGNVDVTNVAVTCTTNAFTVGGTVAGLQGSALTLSLNGGAPIAVGTGPFAFATAVPSGANYAVTVATPPLFPFQICTVTNGTGTMGAANVTDVAVACQ